MKSIHVPLSLLFSLVGVTSLPAQSTSQATEADGAETLLPIVTEGRTPWRAGEGTSGNGGGSTNPPIGDGPAVRDLPFGCTNSVIDALNGTPCIQASRTATLGMLYPLSEVLFVDESTSRVGVGTTTPTSTLSVDGSADISGGLAVGSAGPLPGSFFAEINSSVGKGLRVFDFAGSLTGAWYNEGVADGCNVRLSGLGGPFWDYGQQSDNSFRIQNGAGGFPETLRILPANSGSGGLVGIQTASPANALDVGNRVQLDDAMNGTSDGGIRTRYQAGNLAALISGFFASSSFNGYQIALVNNAGTGLSGSFFHDVPSDTSTIQATVKSFRVDNPDDLYDETDLVYASVEGPEAAMYVRGTGELINGAATIRLPRHFEAMAVAQGMTVQLTPGSAASLGLAVVHKSPRLFQVRELMEGGGNYSFEWEVKAVRKGFEDWQVVRPKLSLPMEEGER